MNQRTPDPERGRPRPSSAPPPTIGPVLGLTEAERERASLASFLRAVVNDDRAELGYFRELTDAVGRAAGMQPRTSLSYLVPGDVLARRDMTAASASGGGYLVGTENVGFAAALEAASVIGALPLTRVPNMVGNARVTREAVQGTAQWLADENTAAPDASATFGEFALAPKTVAGIIKPSRQLVLQAGPAGRVFVERLLATTLAAAVDKALVSGSGTAGAPLGLANTPNIDVRTGASFTHVMSAAMVKVASGWSASSSVACLAGVDAAEDLQTRERATGSGFIADGGRVLDRPLVVSRNVGAQVLVVAPWSSVWMASWGALEVAADPFTHFRDGRVIVRAIWTVDFACERPESVAVATAVT